MLPAAHYGLMLQEASHWLQHYNRSSAFSWYPHAHIHMGSRDVFNSQTLKNCGRIMSLVTVFFSFFLFFLLLSLKQLLLLALISPWWETNRLASGLTLTFKRAFALLSVSQLMSSIHAAAICNSARSISRLQCGEEELCQDKDVATVYNENTASLSEHTRAKFFFSFFFSACPLFGDLFP